MLSEMLVKELNGIKGVEASLKESTIEVSYKGEGILIVGREEVEPQDNVQMSSDYLGIPMETQALIGDCVGKYWGAFEEVEGK